MNFSQIVHFFNRNLHVSLGVLSGCGYHVYMHLEKKGLRIMPLREPLAQTTCTSTEDDVSASLKMPILLRGGGSWQVFVALAQEMFCLSQNVTETVHWPQGAGASWPF